MEAPGHLSHKPIIAVNGYARIDGVYANETDAQALSIGQAQYDEDEISVKVWRLDKNDNWNRNSEEMPVHRALDLSILAIAAFMTNAKSNYGLSRLREEVMAAERVDEIKEYYQRNEHHLRPRLLELRRMLDTFFDQDEHNRRNHNGLIAVKALQV